jgi:hypothetical protein
MSSSWLRPFITDRKFRAARRWSNAELREVAQFFKGAVINVSAWRDEDKEGRLYRNYFPNADSYTISNWRGDARGWQGLEGEVFLDLTADMPEDLAGRFDVVLNHTTLEHIYEIRTAFRNLCLLSRDIVVVIVPFVQQMHGDFGDYWRPTPSTLARMFEENGLDVLRLTYTSQRRASVYLFAVGSRHPDRWPELRRPLSVTCRPLLLDGGEPKVGCRAIVNPLLFRLTQVPAAVRVRMTQLVRWRYGQKG